MALSRRGLCLFLFAFLGGSAAELRSVAAADSNSSVSSKAVRLDLSLCSDEPTFWRRALSLIHDQYCKSVHLAQANLWARPALAEQHIKNALNISPQGVVAQLLLGETWLFQGKAEQAHVQLKKWREVAPLEMLTPRMRVSCARAALLSGDYGDAVAQYRAAVLRLDAISSEREKARILIEAATAAAYASPQSGREVRGYLAIATQKSAPLLTEMLVGAWVLSLVREGRAEEAKAMAQSLSDSWTMTWILDRQEPSWGRASEVLPVLPQGEGFAMAAAVAAVIDPAEADAHWQAFREEASTNWPKHIELSTPGAASSAIDEE